MRHDNHTIGERDYIDWIEVRILLFINEGNQACRFCRGITGAVRDETLLSSLPVQHKKPEDIT